MFDSFLVQQSKQQPRLNGYMISSLFIISLTALCLTSCGLRGGGCGLRSGGGGGGGGGGGSCGGSGGGSRGTSIIRI